MKSLSFKKVLDGRSDKHTTIKYVLIFLQIIIRSQKKIDVRLNKTLKLKFMLMFLDSVYPTPCLSIKFAPYLTGGKIIEMVLGLILLLYSMASKTWLKNALYFTFWDRIFARVRFYLPSFLGVPSFVFILPFRHQDSNSYYLVVIATAKAQKIWKRTSLDVYFSICKSQDRAINGQWIIQPKLIDYLSDTF